MVLETTDPRWADFATTHPAGTPFHHPDWIRLVAGCYGFRAFALAVSDVTGAIRAGLPVVEVRHLRSGPKVGVAPVHGLLSASGFGQAGGRTAGCCARAGKPCRRRTAG